MARVDLFAKIPLIGMSMVFLAMFIVAVTAYLHVGWWSIIGYAVAAVLMVAGFAMTFRRVALKNWKESARCVGSTYSHCERYATFGVPSGAQVAMLEVIAPSSVMRMPSRVIAFIAEAARPPTVPASG